MSAAKMDLRLGLSAGVLPAAFGVVVVAVVLCTLCGEEDNAGPAEKIEGVPSTLIGCRGLAPGGGTDMRGTDDLRLTGGREYGGCSMMAQNFKLLRGCSMYSTPGRRED